VKSQAEDKKKIHIGKGLRLSSILWRIAFGIVVFMGATFAWYSLQIREAETKSVNVVKPYYLTLLNPSETDVLSLPVGSLPGGHTKQIVLCVSNENEQINKDKTAFEYDLELIHTDNLNLNYQVYHLEAANEDAEGVIVAEDSVTDELGAVSVERTYWIKDGAALIGTDVSDKQHQAVKLTNLESIINKGTYISYGKVLDGNGQVIVDNGLELDAGNNSSASQFFLIEITWNEVSNFEKYDKETDMIYVVAKALQEEPE